MPVALRRSQPAILRELQASVTSSAVAVSTCWLVADTEQFKHRIVGGVGGAAREGVGGRLRRGLPRTLRGGATFRCRLIEPHRARSLPGHGLLLPVQLCRPKSACSSGGLVGGAQPHAHPRVLHRASQGAMSFWLRGRGGSDRHIRCRSGSLARPDLGGLKLLGRIIGRGCPLDRRHHRSGLGLVNHVARTKHSVESCFAECRREAWPTEHRRRPDGHRRPR